MRRTQGKSSLPSDLNSNPLIYLRALYRLPIGAFSALACFLFARVTGDGRAFRVWASIMSRVCRRELVITGAPPDLSAQLIVANHVSYLDMIPIFYLWPDCRPVADGRIRAWFLVGRLLRHSVIFVDDEIAGSRFQARAEMQRVWKEGRKVLVFPEGRISRRRGRFQVGSFEEAVSNGVSIQGARISYPAELLAALNGRFFEDRFFWILCQNFQIRVQIFPAERASGEPSALSARWERRLLSDGQTT